MNEETLYWILSTMPQVIGAMTGLVIAGMTFIYGYFDKRVEKKPDTETVIKVIKRQLYWKSISLLGITILAITFDIILLGYTPYLAEQIRRFGSLSLYESAKIFICGEILLGLNIGVLVILIELLVRILNPDIFDEINNELASKERKESKGEDAVPPETFLTYFRKFEKVVRDFFRNESEFSRTGITSLIKNLINESEISKDEFPLIQEIINKRNIFVHGGDIGKVNRKVINYLERLTADLEKRLTVFQAKRRRTRQDEAFRIWIRNNVDDFDDAVQLDHAVRYAESYGIYHVSKDEERLFVRLADGNVLFLNSERAKEHFLEILEKIWGREDASIEDLDAFNRALDKDD